MERYTQRDETGTAKLCEGVPMSEALERLAKLEDFCQNLKQEQEELKEKLGEMRAKNQTKSYQFRELMSKKLLGNEMLIALKYAGLE
ncbi:MAG: hypothetical protein ACOX60_12270 [Massiliimalia sp.]